MWGFFSDCDDDRLLFVSSCSNMANALANAMCERCKSGFAPAEKIVNSNGELYHEQCFVCAQCFQQFPEGLFYEVTPFLSVFPCKRSSRERASVNMWQKQRWLVFTTAFMDEWGVLYMDSCRPACVCTPKRQQSPAAQSRSSLNRDFLGNWAENDKQKRKLKTRFPASHVFYT